MDYVLFVTGTVVLFLQACFWTKRLLEAIRTTLHVPEIDPDDCPDVSSDMPMISVIVPANNEQEGIGECLRSVVNQDYPNFELILVDDRSEDHTAAVAASVSRGRDNFRILSVKELPVGWTGKCHACNVGFQHARGEWLAFLDADSRLHKGALRSCYSKAIALDVNMVTLSPGLVLKTFWEKTLQPVFLGMVSILFPPTRVNDPSSSTAAANGMFFLISRKAYEKIGGHASVRNLAVEDIGIGKRVKPQGLGLLMANGRKVLQTRMYCSLDDILKGWTRILAAAMNYEIAEVFKQLLIHSLISFPVLCTALYFYVPVAHEVWPWTWPLLPVLVAAEICALPFFYYPLLGVPRRYCCYLLLGNMMLVGVLAMIVKKIVRRDALQWRGTTYDSSLYQPKRLDPGPSGVGGTSVPSV